MNQSELIEKVAQATELKPSDGGPGGEGRGKRRSRCPLGRRGGPCLRPRRFQCGGAARTRGAESTNRREHRDRSQQGSAIPRRQGRQRCPQSADSEGGPPEEVCTAKEIRGAEVNVLSLCGGPGPRQMLWPSFSTYEGGFGRETDSPLEGGGFEPSVPRLRWSSV